MAVHTQVKDSQVRVCCAAVSDCGTALIVLLVTDPALYLPLVASVGVFPATLLC